MTEPSPPWLSDAAEALGERAQDGTPLALNWTQVLQGIRALRSERDALASKLASARADLAFISSDVMRALDGMERTVDQLLADARRP